MASRALQQLRSVGFQAQTAGIRAACGPEQREGLGGDLVGMGGTEWGIVEPGWPGPWARRSPRRQRRLGGGKPRCEFV